MVKMTDYESAMLAGEFGEFKQKAMEFNLRYAKVLDAGSFCEVTRATLFIGAHHYLDCYAMDADYKKMFSEFYLCSEKPLDFGTVEKTCESQTCGAACDFREYEKSHVSKAQFERNLSYLKTTSAMGVKLVESCTPYYVGWLPMMGEHFVTTESSNVLVSNSVFGAYGNSDGVEAAVCAAITGRTPLWGMHLRENRYADCIVRITCKANTVFDWDLIGFTMGRLLPKHVVPVIVGNFPHLNIDMFRQFSSAAAVTSATEICHVVGRTPEAHSLEMALGPKKTLYEVEITQKEYDFSYEMISTPGEGPADFVIIGCPHITLHEIRDIAVRVAGKKLKPGVELSVWTDYATKEMANANGYTEAIEKAGGYLLTGSCPLLMREESHRHASAMVISSAKQAYNIRNQTEAPIYYGTMLESVDAALAGYWRGRQ